MTNVLLEYATVFVLSAFVGIEVIAKVPSILHTPLMSGSNAIHGVILVGSMMILGSATTNLEEVLGFLAVILATLNVVGGFVVTDRMLQMFRARRPVAPSSSSSSSPTPSTSTPSSPTPSTSTPSSQTPSVAPRSVTSDATSDGATSGSRELNTNNEAS